MTKALHKGVVTCSRCTGSNFSCVEEGQHGIISEAQKGEEEQRKEDAI